MVPWAVQLRPPLRWPCGAWSPHRQIRRRSSDSRLGSARHMETRHRTRRCHPRTRHRSPPQAAPTIHPAAGPRPGSVRWCRHGPNTTCAGRPRPPAGPTAAAPASRRARQTSAGRTPLPPGSIPPHCTFSPGPAQQAPRRRTASALTTGLGWPAPDHALLRNLVAVDEAVGVRVVARQGGVTRRCAAGPVLTERRNHRRPARPDWSTACRGHGHRPRYRPVARVLPPSPPMPSRGAKRREPRRVDAPRAGEPVR
jgi:hypothetical protein